MNLTSSLSFIIKIEKGIGTGDDWKSEAMAEWNLNLCPSVNISQGHFIPIVCRAQVTAKLN